MPSPPDAGSASHALVRASARVALGLALALPGIGVAPAQDVRIVVQSSPLAGFRYHDAPAVFAQLRPGDALTLVREPGNPHDANAVRVEWQGHTLGYVPRSENAAVAWALDRGEPLQARVSRVREHPNPRMRVELEVFMQ
jgi:hypothetical protein